MAIVDQSGEKYEQIYLSYGFAAIDAALFLKQINACSFCTRERHFPPNLNKICTFLDLISEHISFHWKIKPETFYAESNK